MEISSIPYHTGAHRMMVTPINLPRRPVESNLSTTLEYVVTDKFMDGICLHRKDTDKWHWDYELLGYRDNRWYYYGDCIHTISIYSTSRSTMDMIVREKEYAFFDNTKDRLPPRYYKIPLPVFSGLTHYTWCSNMELEVESEANLEKLLQDPQYSLGKELDRQFGPTIFFPDLTGSTLYHRCNGKYKPALEVPFPKHAAPTENKPAFAPVRKQDEDISKDVTFIPCWIHLLAQKKEPLTLQAQSWLLLGAEITRATLDDTLPPFLRPKYVHLRYKPRKPKGGELYQYQGKWREGYDMQKHFPIRSPFRPFHPSHEMVDI